MGISAGLLGTDGSRIQEWRASWPAARAVEGIPLRDTNRQKGISVSTVSEETGLVPKELHGLSFGNIWAVTGGMV